MCIATSPDFPINPDITHKYIASLGALKTMMHILSDELERGAREVYPNVVEARVRFHKDVTFEYMDTIADN